MPAAESTARAKPPPSLARRLPKVGDVFVLRHCGVNLPHADVWVHRRSVSQVCEITCGTGWHGICNMGGREA